MITHCANSSYYWWCSVTFLPKDASPLVTRNINARGYGVEFPGFKELICGVGVWGYCCSYFLKWNTRHLFCCGSSLRVTVSAPLVAAVVRTCGQTCFCAFTVWRCVRPQRGNTVHHHLPSRCSTWSRSVRRCLRTWRCWTTRPASRSTTSPLTCWATSAPTSRTRTRGGARNTIPGLCACMSVQ